jgi:hypothetical protein
MKIEVFNRIEQKFMLTLDQFDCLIPHIKKEMDLDEYIKEKKFYSIQNLYFDTESDYLIKYSLSKPVFKEKLRIRAYGKVNLESYVYIELKKKMDGVVNKRRSQIRLCEAYKFISTKELPEIKEYHNEQVLKEIQQFLNRYSVKASTYIAYDRIAYKKDNFRVTVDYNIRTRKDALRLEYIDNGLNLLEEDIFLLEAKSTLGLPLWFVNTLSELKIYKTFFRNMEKIILEGIII